MADKEAIYKDLASGETEAQTVSVYDQTTTPTNEAAKAKLYAKDVGGVAKMHALSSDGTEIELGTGSGGGGSIQTLTSSTNQTAIDASLGTQYKLNDLAENTEFQIPTNGTDGMYITISVENTGGHIVSFAAGYNNVGQLDVPGVAGSIAFVEMWARDFGAGLEWSYSVTHSESVTGVVDIDAETQTLNNTPVTIASYATQNDDAIYGMEAMVIFVDGVNNHTWLEKFHCKVFRDELSALTVSGPFFDSGDTSDDPAWDVDVTTSGTTILIRVTGDDTNATRISIKGYIREAVA